jgi:hypothetical protein
VSSAEDDEADQLRPAWDALRPTHRWGPDDLDLDAAIFILHQELRRATDTGHPHGDLAA